MPCPGRLCSCRDVGRTADEGSRHGDPATGGVPQCESEPVPWDSKNPLFFLGRKTRKKSALFSYKYKDFKQQQWVMWLWVKKGKPKADHRFWGTFLVLPMGCFGMFWVSFLSPSPFVLFKALAIASFVSFLGIAQPPYFFCFYFFFGMFTGCRGFDPQSPLFYMM